ncbi:hypothetical protein Amsp01_051830 [Amycolatopsis sp. NBRC 101858]|nr:hypothetical protein Amsp01_051830 [Amycolatopsis sp. NBRC 101858]
MSSAASGRSAISRASALARRVASGTGSMRAGRGGAGTAFTGLSGTWELDDDTDTAKRLPAGVPGARTRYGDCARLRQMC